MRVSRPCYNKFHRCPGWSGGGIHSAKVYRCQGGYVTWPTGKLRLFKIARCNKCDVVVLPFNIRYVDPAYLIKWEIPHMWRDFKYWRKEQKDRPCKATRLLAWTSWYLDPIRLFEHIPGFNKAYEDVYDRWVERGYEEIHDNGTRNPSR